MIKRRDDRSTLDLFDWEPPAVAAGYGPEVDGRGDLSSRISRQVAQALRDATDGGMARAEIAAQISKRLGRRVSIDTLNKWASEAGEEHRIPLDGFIALVEVTGATALLGFMPGLFGFVAVPERYAGIIEMHLLEEHEAEIAARKAALAAKWKAKR
jgi:hypothetical protein